MSKTRANFFNTDEGKDIKRQLQEIADSSLYNTPSSYSPNRALYPDNRMPFVDKQINYLIKYPLLDARMYVADIKHTTRLRP